MTTEILFEQFIEVYMYIIYDKKMLMNSCGN